jgi:DNA primase
LGALYLGYRKDGALSYAGRPVRVFQLEAPAIWSNVPFEALKLAARDVRQRLKRRGPESSLKCTGKGLHVTVALAGEDQWPDLNDSPGPSRMRWLPLHPMPTWRR